MLAVNLFLTWLALASMLATQTDRKRERAREERERERGERGGQALALSQLRKHQ